MNILFLQFVKSNRHILSSSSCFCIAQTHTSPQCLGRRTPSPSSPSLRPCLLVMHTWADFITCSRSTNLHPAHVAIADLISSPTQHRHTRRNQKNNNIIISNIHIYYIFGPVCRAMEPNNRLAYNFGWRQQRGGSEGVGRILTQHTHTHIRTWCLWFGLLRSAQRLR